MSIFINRNESQLAHLEDVAIENLLCVVVIALPYNYFRVYLHVNNQTILTITDFLNGEYLDISWLNNCSQYISILLPVRYWTEGTCTFISYSH